MQRAAVLVVALAVGGCGASGLTIANRVGLGVQTAALACDWGGTRASAAAGWGYYRKPDGTWWHRSETNPMLGPSPTTSEVDAYFLGALALITLGWYALPSRWKFVAPLVVTAIEAKAAVVNVANDVGVCGF